MKRNIFLTKKFKKIRDELIKQHRLLIEDYYKFENGLLENPELGDLVQGTNGVRKIRLKSATSGKSDGFRVCYYYFLKNEELYLLLIYPKNKQSDLTAKDKKILKEVTNEIKKK